MDIDKQTVALITAAVASIATFGYKALRIIKSDRTADSLTTEEQSFRASLREECNMLRELTSKLHDDKLSLAMQIAKLETETEMLKAKCESCRASRAAQHA